MKSIVLRLSLVALTLMVAASAWASLVMELRVDELTKRADEVVRARVLDRISRWTEDGHQIHTFTTIEVISNMKGAAGGAIVIRQLGGEVDGVGSFVGGDAHFEVGEEVVVFLRRNPDGEPVFHLIGLAQGKFRVERTGDRVSAVRDLSDLAMMRVVDGRYTPGGHGGLTTLPLDELASAVDAAAQDQ